MLRLFVDVFSVLQCRHPVMAAGSLGLARIEILELPFLLFQRLITFDHNHFFLRIIYGQTLIGRSVAELLRIGIIHPELCN